MKIFIDTSAIIAYFNSDDRFHGEAEGIMRDLTEGRIPLTRLYVSDYVFDEAVTFIECVLRDHALAVDIGAALLSSPFTTMLRVEEEAFEEAWERFRAGEGLSFTDCSSFALMERLGISHAFTFDRHFTEAGFHALP